MLKFSTFLLLTSFILLSVLPATLLARSPSTSPQSGPSQTALEQAARTILEKNCMSCHGDLQISDFDMRTRDTLLKGGKRGPAVVPGKAEESRLYLAASHTGDLAMPPKKPPLPPEDLEILRKWINEGVPWTATVAAHAQRPQPSWWSFRIPQRPEIPKVKNASWVRNPIDAFILASVEVKGLTHAPAADKRTLIRRAYFDLIGLPPTPKEVESFLNDSSSDAYEKLIEKLLASAQYGERWGRHWLDVVRYADSAGYEPDNYLPNAWRYRDYVIKSLNEDKPYDRFLQEQIAGDELWSDDLALHGSHAIALEKLEHLEGRVGTGFYTIGPEILESNLDAKLLLNERLTDWADTTGAAFLGLTFGCARCHNHKFDPISQRDYYGFQAIFAGSDPVGIPVVPVTAILVRNQSYPTVLALDEARIAFRLFEDKIMQRVIKDKKQVFSRAVVEAYEIPKEKRTPAQEELAQPLIEAIQSIKLEDHLTSEEQLQHKKLLEQLGKAVLAVPEKEGGHDTKFDGLYDVPTASVLSDHETNSIPDIYILERGDLGRPKEKVHPDIPTALSDGSVDFEESFSGPYVPRRREKLALWLSRPDHPLTGRVMVNRIWQWHFGRGIVGTPNDFGRQGQAPTNPELLDWLATEFVARGWSLKSMHRLIMLSNTYQMSSQYSDGNNMRVDPDNHYLWRMNRRRLEGEALWDAMHAVAGTLNLKMGGRPVALPLAEDELTALGSNKMAWPVAADPAEHNRRGVYILVRRNFTYPMFEAFDSPDNAVSCPEREESTVAPQALWFLNNRLAFRQAQEFAARVVSEEGDNSSAWVDKAWRLALSRIPSEKEKREAMELMETLAKKKVGTKDWPELPASLAHIPAARAAALAKLCLLVFNLDEFTYID
jgi:hypothetical protein